MTYNNINYGINIISGISNITNFVDGILSKYICMYSDHEQFLELIETIEKIKQGTVDNMCELELYNYIASSLAMYSSVHPIYGDISKDIIIDKIRKYSCDDIVHYAYLVHNNEDKCGKKYSLINELVFHYIISHGEELNKIINEYEEYYGDYDYFGLKTLEKSYLMKIYIRDVDKFVTIERPEQLLMRVTLGIVLPEFIDKIDDETLMNWMNDNLEDNRKNINQEGGYFFIPSNNKIINQIGCLRSMFKLNDELMFDIRETYDALAKKKYTHATPTLYNAATKNQQLSSCYLMSVDDDLDSMYDGIKNMARISKLGGGISVSLSSLRAKGSIIKGSGEVGSGIIPYCRVIESTGKHVNQGGRRAGSIACYLEPHHADIKEFCTMRTNTGNEQFKMRDLFFGLWVSDLFMKCVDSDHDWYLMSPDECPGLDKIYGEEFETLYYKYVDSGFYREKIKARYLWNIILTSQFETGMPYLLFKDSANHKSNQKNLGTIRCSNLCVAPETKILTDRGYFEISSLVDQNVNVWNGSEFSDVRIVKTGENQELIDVHTNNGFKLSCTKYHKFFICNGRGCKQPVSIVEAKNLKNGDRIINCQYPIIDGSDNVLYPFTHGYYCGLRHLLMRDTGKIITLTGNEIILEPHFDFIKKDIRENCGCRKGCLDPIMTDYTLPDDFNYKIDVPINSSIDTKMKWLSGLFETSCLEINENKIVLSFLGIDEFVNDLKLLLQTCGIHSSYDKTIMFGGTTLSMIIISFGEVSKLFHLGLKTYGRIINLPERLPIDYNEFVCINKVVDDGRIDDTYCFNEPKNHSGIFNGMITSQCSEIILYTDKNEIAVCNLASISLPKFINNKNFDYDELLNVTRVIVKNLNRIIDINLYPSIECERSNIKNRPIGIGVQGLSDVFNILKLPFDSDDAMTLNKKIFETIYFAAVTESNNLAIKYGSYETFKGSPASKGLLQFHLWENYTKDFKISHLHNYDWDTLIESVKKYGLRNSVLTTCMPTASTSQIMGNYESIEPILSNIFTRQTNSGEFIIVNKYLVNDLIDLGLWSKKLRDLIIYFKGNISELTFIPKYIRDVYKTIFDMGNKPIINHSINRGPYIDQSQSMNLYMDIPSVSKLNSAHFYSWKKGLKTGCYYLRSIPGFSPNSFGISINDTNVNNSISSFNKKKYIVSNTNDDDDICVSCSA